MSEFQEKIMRYIDSWVRSQKKPIPRQQVFQAMLDEGMEGDTITRALEALVRKSYIRKGKLFDQRTRAVCYTQVRSI